MIKNIALVLLLTFPTRLLAGGQAYGEFSHEGDSVHVEFLGKSQWDYDISRKIVADETQIELTLPEINEDSLRKIRNWREHGLK